MIRFSTQPGSSERPNEDWCGGITTSTGDHLLVLLDGVTTPGETGCRHGTPWYVQQLGLNLLQLGSSAGTPLAEALAGAIEHVTHLHADTCNIAHRGTPAAAVAIARTRANHLDYLVLADTTVAINRASSSEIQAISDSRVAAVTEKDAAEVLQHPIGTPEHASAVSRMSVNQQEYRNHPGGYWVAASTPEAAAQAITGEVDDALEVALFSDGASRSVDLFAEHTWTELMETLRRGGPDLVINQVRAAERKDPTGVTWPRFKTSDDAACAYADTPGDAPHEEAPMRNDPP
jgi:hypothetical protein